MDAFTSGESEAAALASGDSVAEALAHGPGAPAAPSLIAAAALPADRGLPEFSQLFNGEWVWRHYRSRLGAPAEAPASLRLRQLSYNPGRRALASYYAEWPWDDFVTQEQFAIELAHDRPVRLYRYPDDPHLPGLARAASAETAADLLSRHVLAAGGQRVRVSVARYRPGGHAVLRHRHGRVRFYARVMRPRRVPRLLAAAELVGQTGFVLPRLAGCWPAGGVVWLSEIPGQNVRRLVRGGERPDLGQILENLAQLWEAPMPAGETHQFDLYGAYRRARRIFRQVREGHDDVRRALKDATAGLDGFARAWEPITTAHNDFYDDQMVRTPDGRFALVDFEEAGPGDPLLDVGNFLAHARWSARFGSETEARASGACYREFRAAALERFGWDERALALREAVCIFRVCTNPIRHLAPDWPQRLAAGLALVNEVLA